MSSRILVALATTRHSDELGPRAVEEAKALGLPLTLLLVTEREEIDRVYQLRSDPLLLGPRPLEEILGEIEEEHRRMLERQEAEIERLAVREGVDVETIAVAGRYEDELARAIQAGDYRVIYWLKLNRGFLARFFLGADAAEVVRVERRRGS